MAGTAVMMGKGMMRGSAKRSHGTMRLTTRGKLVVALLAAALTWAGISVVSPVPAHSEAGATAVSSYIVRPGDTLWSYASSITPAGQDVSNTVDELIELNDLESGALQAGQRIVVPQR
ncbi:LysM peptidoglycan-binding domain-containing protein [Bifidobacterium eulemuris]|uniref:Peptidoglycan-binding protein LysM n=2 Tax=Bifidobacterium eulemuris TaxID=1765219 RepID=A0A261G846_9BIFI|nr:peptidoglycan-binding protein LysM [Bifidobacterium eulemuris]